jgi:hypothetical protein
MGVPFRKKISREELFSWHAGLQAGVAAPQSVE